MSYLKVGVFVSPCLCIGCV